MKKGIQNIYIHLPFCLKKCFYCSFPVHAVGVNAQTDSHFKELSFNYQQKLLQEIKLTDAALSQKNSQSILKSIYFGGGTPSLVDVSMIESILIQLKSLGYYYDKQSTEISIECDPATFDKQKLDCYQDIGINRISLGIQSFNDKVLKQMNRYHRNSNIIDSISLLQNSSSFRTLNNVSFDLIMNRPLFANINNHLNNNNHNSSKIHDQILGKELNSSIQTQEQLSQIWIDDLTQAISYIPGHLSIYSMAIEPTSLYYDRLKLREGEGMLPSNEQAVNCYKTTHEILSNSGYSHYEVSNYIKQNQNIPQHSPIYWLGNKEFLGFGMGASSLVNGKRYTRPTNLKRYYEYVEQLKQNNSIVLSIGEDESNDQQKMQSILMGRLRTQQGVNLNDISNIFGPDVAQDLTDIVNKLIKTTYNNYKDKKIIELNNGNINMNIPNGYLMVDEVVADICIQLDKIKANKQRAKHLQEENVIKIREQQ